MLSANIKTGLETTDGMSFANTVKSIGHKTDHCGTPLVTKMHDY